MAMVSSSEVGSQAPRWISRPEALHQVAYSAAALIFAGQLVAIVVMGTGWPTALSVLVGGVGVAVSWRYAWTGLVITSAASFAVSAAGRDPLSVWMLAVLVLFSCTLRGRQPLAATALVAGVLLASFMTVGGFRGGSAAGAAAVFSAVAGGATGAALRSYRAQWMALAEQARTAIVTREIEATRRVTEERLRIARDLHDVIAHQVAMLSVHLGVAEVALPDGAESSRQALESARSSGRTVIDETQRILALLRRGTDTADDEALRPTPALSGLGPLIASFEDVGLNVDSSIDLPAGFAEPGVGVTVYRVVQEGLTNAYRYGNGTATVDVRLRDGRFCVTVQNPVDDSRRETQQGSGLGLVGMRERVESFGGRLTVDDDDTRFQVRAEFHLAGALPL
jgi:signal transduction histidine kinase